jgi:hypothetical protein
MEEMYEALKAVTADCGPRLGELFGRNRAFQILAALAKAEGKSAASSASPKEVENA